MPTAPAVDFQPDTVASGRAIDFQADNQPPIDFQRDSEKVDFRPDSKPIDFQPDDGPHTQPVSLNRTWQATDAPETSDTGRIVGDPNVAEGLWEGLNQPIVKGQPPIEEVERVAKQGTPLERKAMGVRLGADEFLSGMTSPLGIATVGLSRIPAIGRALSAAFAVHTGKTVASDIPKAIGDEMGKPEDQRDVTKLFRLWTAEALGTGMTAGLGLHAATPTPKAGTGESTDARAGNKTLGTAGGSRTNPVTVKSRADYEGLQPGDWFVDAEGLKQKAGEPRTEAQPQAPESEAEASTDTDQPPAEPKTAFGRVTDLMTGGGAQDFSPIRTAIKSLAGQSMPRTTEVAPELGEKGARYASSRIAAPHLAKAFVQRVLADSGIDETQFGAALTEDNLRSVRDTLAREGNAEAADQVQTIIGAKGSPFKTEQQYQDFLDRPEVRQAVNRHRAMWDESVEPMYRNAMGIDPDVELPTRGQQTGARINLFVPPEEGPVQRSIANLTATFKRKSPFGAKAYGSAQTYGLDYSDLMENTFGRQLEIANKNIFDKALVDSGNAVIDRPGQQIRIKGEDSVAFPYQRRTVVLPEGQTTAQNQSIYVRRSLAREYAGAANIYGGMFTGSAVAKVNHAINFAQLAALTDATVHVSNLGGALLTRPGTAGGGLLSDTLLSAFGRADIPVRVLQAVKKSLSDNGQQLAELAEIGAERETHQTINPLSRTVHWADKNTRLLLDDIYQNLVKQGVADYSETERREFVNQVGQYNKRLQPVFTAALRGLGVSPFITAGKTMNALGLKTLILDPGMSGSTALQSAFLRANVAAKWTGTIALVAAINWLLTKDKGGGVAGRPGTPLGRIDTGKNDAQGRPLTIAAFDMMGFGRGLRVSGIKGAVDAKRMGLPNQTALDSAARDVINSWTAPGAGPAIRFGVQAATGYPPAVGVGRTSPVVPPGKSQHLADVKNAALDVNPIVAGIHKATQPGGSVRDAIASQMPRFTLQPGKAAEVTDRYPDIVHGAQLKEYLEDVAKRARKMAAKEREDYLTGIIASLPREDAKHAADDFKKRKLWSQ